jgi:dihydrofolate reductase
MAKLTLDLTMSLDGFIAGPNQTVEQPLGVGGERLHEWIYGLATFRERYGESGGTRNADDDVLWESMDAAGAVLMGRRMFSGGDGRWEDDPVADGWWGDDPPFGVPVFVLTHHARETVTKQGGRDDVHVRHRGARRRGDAGSSGRGREDRRCGRRRERRPAVPARRFAGRDTGPPRAPPARGRRSPLRRSRCQSAGAGGDEGDRIAGGDARQIQRHEVTSGNAATSDYGSGQTQACTHTQPPSRRAYVSM